MNRVLPALVLLLPLAASAAKMELPRMPEPALVDTPERPLKWTEIRVALETTLPAGQRLVLDGAPPAGAVGSGTAEGEPQPVAVIHGRFPVLDLADSNYSRLRHDFLPVLLDWFDALLVASGRTPEEARAHGLLTNKVARLMRVFAQARIHRSRGAPVKLALALGWGRFHLNEDWGRCAKGSTHTFVVVGTEKGWFILDPYTRRLRPLQKGDSGIVAEFIVL